MKNLDGRKKDVKVRSFLGATTRDMTDFVKSFPEKPERVILHVSTNIR